MPDRLENLRRALTLNWGELATKLEISRAMLDFIRTGARNPSAKVLRKIEQAEIEAGIKNGMTTHEDQGLNETGSMKREMLEEMVGIKKELDVLSKRVDDFVKRLK